MKDFSVFLDTRRYKNWAHKIGSSWNYLTIWRRVLPVFARAQSASFLFSTWAPYRGCWKTAAAAAHALILVEADGKCQWKMPICSWQRLHGGDGTFSWAFKNKHSKQKWRKKLCYFSDMKCRGTAQQRQIVPSGPVDHWIIWSTVASWGNSKVRGREECSRRWYFNGRREADVWANSVLWKLVFLVLFRLSWIANKWFSS